MTDDLRASIGFMRDIVERLRTVPWAEDELAARDTLLAILEEQIREMEQRQAERQGAWS